MHHGRLAGIVPLTVPDGRGARTISNSKWIYRAAARRRMAPLISRARCMMLLRAQVWAAQREVKKAALKAEARARPQHAAHNRASSFKRRSRCAVSRASTRWDVMHVSLIRRLHTGQAKAKAKLEMARKIEAAKARQQANRNGPAAEPEQGSADSSLASATRAAAPGGPGAKDAADGADTAAAVAATKAEEDAQAVATHEAKKTAALSRYKAKARALRSA